MTHPVTLLIDDLEGLNRIQKKLAIHLSLTKDEEAFLSQFLSTLPPVEKAKAYFPSDHVPEVRLLDLTSVKAVTEQWVNLYKRLFKNIDPDLYVATLYDEILKNGGLDEYSSTFSPLGYNGIIVIDFYPTLSHKLLHKGFELIMQIDGNAFFNTDGDIARDEKDFPEFVNFKGTWKDGVK